MKRCSRCHETKAKADFNKRTESKDGLDGRCKTCIKILNDTYTSKNREQLKLAHKAYREANPEKLRSSRRLPKARFALGRSMAIRRGLDWFISYEDYLALIAQPCTYCQASLEGEAGHSLDRVDNAKGYEIANVLPSCGQCNKIRNVFFTVEETRLLIQTVLDFRRKQSA